MSRLVRVAVLILAGVLLVGTPVFAYLYRAPIAVTETDGNSYNMLPVVWTQNNDWLAANGFMDADARDTRVQTLGGLDKPHLVTEDKTLTAVSIDADSQTNLYFVTGETSQDMDIVLGYGGYVTVTDDPALELGDSFAVTVSDSYFGANVLELHGYKPGAWALSARDTQTVGFDVLSASSIVNAGGSAGADGLYTGAKTRAGQRVDAFTQGIITQVSVSLKKVGSPTGTGYMRLRDVATDNIIGTFGSIDVSTIDIAYAYYDFTGFVYNPIAQDVRFSFEYDDGGDVVNYVQLEYNGVATTGLRTHYTAGWTDDGVNDCRIKIYYGAVTKSVTATGIVAGEHDVEVTADTTDLKIFVDGSEEDSVALGGSSVPDTANDLVLMDSVSYWGSFIIAVAGSGVIHYAPDDIIIGTTLPDLEGAAQDGVITWGSNPAGVSVSVGSMISSGQSGIGATSDGTVTSDLLPAAGNADWNVEPDVSGALLTNPLRPIITAISDNTTLSERQVWVLTGITFVVFVTVLVGANVRGHHLITGIAASVAIILMVVWTVFPLLSLLVVVLAVWGGLVSERSPSL